MPKTKAAAKTKRRNSGPPRRRKGLLPDEYERQGLVVIKMALPEARKFAPLKLKELETNQPGRIDLDSRTLVEERYITTVHKLFGVWEFEVEHEGDKWAIPHAVFKRMQDYYNAIVKEQRAWEAHRNSNLRRGEAETEDEPQPASLLG